VNSHKGFTIIELIVVIVIIGILAVTVAPKLLTSRQFSAEAVTDKYIAHLRLVQLKALNYRGVCHNSIFQAVSGTTVFGIPINTTATCGTTTASDTQNDVGHSTITLINGSTNADIAVSPQIIFDVFGVPAAGGNCSGACKFKIVATDTVYMCVESQGYIHKVTASYVCT
jgi:MSHA pilin protein MshC